jgi:hypothetical protein
MGPRAPRVDAYIDKAAEFSRPILSHLREMVHTGCPDVEETIKWGFPISSTKACSAAWPPSSCTAPSASGRA